MRGHRSWRRVRAILESIPDDSWESICEGCGRCCFEREVESDGTIIAWGAPCPWLDVTTRRCRAYDQRFSLGAGCEKVTPRTATRHHRLPPGCAYRRLADRLRRGEELPSWLQGPTD